MKEHSFPGRANFKSSGKTNFGMFVPSLVFPFVAAAVLAALMFLLFRVGHYYVLIVPALAGLALAGCMKFAIRNGHCRSPLVGALAGLCAGMILYLGYYYCGMVYHFGRETITRPDLLPRYINARMKTDVLRGTHDYRRDDDPANPREGNVWMNWITFSIESVIVIAFAVGAAVANTRKPYCEKCRRWMKREITLFDPAQETDLTEAFRNNSAQALAIQCSGPVFATVPSLMLAADICPSVNDGKSRDCPVYASLKNVQKAVNAPTLDPFDSAQGNLLLRSIQLNPDEIAALGSRFKILQSLADPAAVTTFTPPKLAEEEHPPGTIAEIKPVEPEFAGKVLTKRTALIANAFMFGALLMMFLGLGLALLGGMTAFPDDKTVVVSSVRMTFGITLLSLGIVSFIGTVVLFLASPSYLSNRYLLKLTKNEFGRRSNRLVEPTDPDAMFVEIVPKLNWGKFSLETASDIGFLKVDRARGEILFEGDKERWRIPATAITHCEVEFFVEGQGTAGATKIFFTVLRAKHPTGFWEAPVRERTGAGLFRSGYRQRSAMRLSGMIREMRA